MSKLYKSEAWLRLRYVSQGKKIKEIADECGVVELTIRRELEKLGLIRK